MARENDATERAALILRALTLQELVNQARVSAGSLAECDLERGKADLAEAVAALEQTETSLRLINERLKTVAVKVSSALYMSGMSSVEGDPVTELRVRLAAWYDSAG